MLFSRHWEAHKLHIQVVDVVMEIAFERIAMVKISDGRTQPIGAEKFSQNRLHGLMGLEWYSPKE
jgi:hypothetical protein